MNEFGVSWSNEVEKRLKIMTEIPPLDPDKTDSPSSDCFENFNEAMKKGFADGSAKARAAAPELKTGVANAFHDLAYGVAYGSVFAGTFLTELVPEGLREGFSKGAKSGKEAGQRASDRVYEAMKGNKSDENTEFEPKSSFS